MSARLVEVLAAHWAASMAPSGAAREWECACWESLEMSDESHQQHVAEQITAAGYGPVREVEAERDHWRGRFDRMRRMYRERWTEGLSTADWHEKHCAAAQNAARERARAERAEAERDALVRQVIAARSRAEEANTALADLRAAVEALADGIKAGTADFMAGFDRAGEGISTRMSGETAAAVVMVRSEMESHVRALVAQQRDGGGSE